MADVWEPQELSADPINFTPADSSRRKVGGGLNGFPSRRSRVRVPFPAPDLQALGGLPSNCSVAPCSQSTECDDELGQLWLLRHRGRYHINIGRMLAGAGKGTGRWKQGILDQRLQWGN
jgi:hypothetical protein